MTIELITHAGVFHADDIMSTALLKMVYEKFGSDIKKSHKSSITIDPIDEMAASLINITDQKADVIVHRTNDVNDYTKNFDRDSIFNVSADGNIAIVYDIGGGILDHHQQDSIVRNDGGKYSSFGILWSIFGLEVIKMLTDIRSLKFYTEVWKKVDEHFVKHIDAHDNGENFDSLSSMIDIFNLGWDDCDEGQMTRFMNCVDVAMLIIAHEIQCCTENVLNSYLVNEKKYSGSHDENHNLNYNKTDLKSDPFVVHPNMKTKINLKVSWHMSDQIKFKNSISKTIYGELKLNDD